jgi:hypothetical protein
MHFQIGHLFGENQFWDNTRKKHNIPRQGPLMGSTLKKRNLVLVNLTDTWIYCKDTRQRFDLIYAKVIAHELFHLIIMDEVLAEKDCEEWVVSRAIGIRPMVFE